MGCCCCKPKTEAKEKTGLDETQKKIIKAMAEIKKPSGCKDIADKAGLESPSVAGKLRGLKTAGLVESPEEGKYVLTASGKKEAK